MYLLSFLFVFSCIFHKKCLSLHPDCYENGGKFTSIYKYSQTFYKFHSINV